MGYWSLDLRNDLVEIDERTGIKWTDVKGVRNIRSLAYTTDYGHRIELAGYDQYGFQRYMVSSVDSGGQIGNGAQIIGVRGGVAMVVDIDETNRRSSRTLMGSGELTYSKKLLVDGG